MSCSSASWYPWSLVLLQDSVGGSSRPTGKTLPWMRRGSAVESSIILSRGMTQKLSCLLQRVLLRLELGSALQYRYQVSRAQGIALPPCPGSCAQQSSPERRPSGCSAHAISIPFPFLPANSCDFGGVRADVLLNLSLPSGSAGWEEKEQPSVWESFYRHLAEINTGTK